MRIVSFLVILWLTPFLLVSHAMYGQDSVLTVMTYNIRFDNPDDGSNAWPYRRQAVIDLITKYDPDLLGVQEALVDQVNDIDEGMGIYSWYGVGRDNGLNRGEFSAIFFRDNMFDFLDGQTFWLSETPRMPGSMGWDAACTRVVSWVKLRHQASGGILFHFNTHFDHMGDTARLESAGLLLEMIHTIAGESPVIVTGDFNLKESEAPYHILTDTTLAFYITNTQYLTDKPSGPDYTYIGFDFIGEPGEIIDYIFVRNMKEVLFHQIITDNDNGIYPSDHLPVMIKLVSH